MFYSSFRSGATSTGFRDSVLGKLYPNPMVTKLQNQKHPLLVSAIFNGERWCYFDTTPGGLVVEFREEYKKKA